MDKNKFIADSLKESSEIKLKVLEKCSEDILKVSELIIRRIKEGNKLMLIGNGGSAAAASHLATDLAKLTTRPGQPRLKALAWWTVASMLVGGILLGMLVTRYAFGEWWTGFPLGHDITDSKTLLAQVAWLLAALAVGRTRLDRAWVVLAALVTLAIFAIPHSWTAREPSHDELDGTRALAVASVAAESPRAAAR